MLCLKQELVVSKGQTVECLAVHCYEDTSGGSNTEVWAGSGEVGSQSQLSWFNVDCGKNEVRASCVNSFFNFK